MNENFTEWLHGWVGAINDPMWSYLVYMLLGTGLFFTVTTGFVQFRLFGRSIKEMLGGRKQGTTSRHHAVSGICNRPCQPRGRGQYRGRGNRHQSRRAGRGVLDVGNRLNRHEFGVCRIFAGAAL